MSEIEKILKDVVYGGIGAVAKVTELGGKLINSLVSKGREVVAEKEPEARAWAEKVRDACRDTWQTEELDVENMTREARDALAAHLKELADAEDAEAWNEIDADDPEAWEAVDAVEEPEEAAAPEAPEAPEAAAEPEKPAVDWMEQVADACRQVQETVGVNFGKLTHDLREALADSLRQLTAKPQNESADEAADEAPQADGEETPDDSADGTDYSAGDDDASNG